MKYFTKELWVGAQDFSNAKENDKAWKLAQEQYQAQFKALQNRLDSSAIAFFLEADVHDGHLVSVEVRDGRHVTYQNEEPNYNFFPVSARLVIKNHNSAKYWSIEYTNIRRSIIDFPSDEPAFYDEGEGFNDIGYDELTDAGNGFLRHEILFSSGASILFEFKNVNIELKLA